MTTMHGCNSSVDGQRVRTMSDILSDMQLLGLAMMAAIALLVMLVALRRQPRAIWLFAFALVVVGLGYLATTQAPTEFAQLVIGTIPPSPAPVTAQ